MNDTNIVLYLKGGEEVKVIYPNRVFLEYDSPWLERPGGVQTSDPLRDLTSGGGFGKSSSFVISTWKNFPKYKSQDDGRIRTIPIHNVMSIAPADAKDAFIGNTIRQKEQDDEADASYKEGVVTRKELAEILRDFLRSDLAEKVLTRPR